MRFADVRCSPVGRRAFYRTVEIICDTPRRRVLQPAPAAFREVTHGGHLVVRSGTVRCSRRPARRRHRNAIPTAAVTPSPRAASAQWFAHTPRNGRASSSQSSPVPRLVRLGHSAHTGTRRSKAASTPRTRRSSRQNIAGADLPATREPRCKTIRPSGRRPCSAPLRR